MYIAPNSMTLYYVYCFLTVIYVNFSQAVYSGEEANGAIIIMIEADGFSVWPFSVLVTPKEIGGTSMLQ